MTGSDDRKFDIRASYGFTDWLKRLGGSLTVTTYQAGRVLILSGGPDSSLSLVERDFPRSMGIAVSPDVQSFFLATQFQIYRFNNVIAPGEAGAFDAAYIPHVAWLTGSVDAHDVGIDANDRPVFVNTLYSCIAAVSDVRNFKPLWKPPFISELVPEDRCHLNGMCMLDGRLRFATAASSTDVKDGWRNHRGDGGVVIDVDSNETIVQSLTMPHSPRFYDNRLWILNSGAGQFGFVDLARGTFEPIAFCPGYARGLSFVDRFAIIGLSGPRNGDGFGGLILDEALKSRNLSPFCGLLIVDIHTGAIVEWVRFDGAIMELYDTAYLPGVSRPSLIGFKTDEIKKRISIENSEMA